MATHSSQQLLESGRRAPSEGARTAISQSHATLREQRLFASHQGLVTPNFGPAGCRVPRSCEARWRNAPHQSTITAGSCSSPNRCDFPDHGIRVLGSCSLDCARARSLLPLGNTPASPRIPVLAGTGSFPLSICDDSRGKVRRMGASGTGGREQSRIRQSAPFQPPGLTHAPPAVSTAAVISSQHVQTKTKASHGWGADQ